MKKKILIITSILLIVFIIIGTVVFFLMKKSDSSIDNTEPAEYDVSQVVKKIDFLKLNTYDEVKKYIDENHYFQKSSDEKLFGAGELYIEEYPVTLLYQLNDDKSLMRFDGTYSYQLKDSSVESARNVISVFDQIVSAFFECGTFDHSVFDENGAPIINCYSDETYELFFNGKAKYSLSIIDEKNTYWRISATVKDKKQIDFEFFRCYNEGFYSDDSPNIDLRVQEESGEQ